VGSYVLKAVAVDNAGATAESSPVTVTVSANKPPLVSLVSPLTGMTFAAPATIPLTAIASDLDGSIQKVDFYNGSTLIGSDSTSPYTFNWLNVAAGSYSVSAIARDNLGATTVSSWSEVRPSRRPWCPEGSSSIFSRSLPLEPTPASPRQSPARISVSHRRSTACARQT
jgi:hypothetical protein